MMQKQRYRQNASNLEEQKQLFTQREERLEENLGEAKQGCHLGKNFNGVKQFHYLTQRSQSSQRTNCSQNFSVYSVVRTTLTAAEQLLGSAGQRRAAPAPQRRAEVRPVTPCRSCFPAPGTGLAVAIPGLCFSLECRKRGCELCFPLFSLSLENCAQIRFFSLCSPPEQSCHC